MGFLSTHYARPHTEFLTVPKWSGYHRRSLVETKMHCFKLLGQRVMSRTFERQITELKVRVAILNRFSQIGTPNTVRVG